MAVGQPGQRQRVLRFELQGLFQQPLCRSIVLAGEPGDVPAPPHGQVPHLQTVGGKAPDALHFRGVQLGAGGTGHAGHDVVLHLKQPLQLHVVAFGPQLAGRLGLDQACRDAQAATQPARAAGEGITHAQLRAEPAQVRMARWIGERGAGGDDVEPAELAQLRDDVFHQPGSHVHLVVIPAQ